MKKENFIHALEQLKDESRNFKQTYELIINLSGINLKKPEEQVELWVALPHGTGKEVKIGALVGAELKEQAGENCDVTILQDDFGKYTDKKEVKKLSRTCDYFIAQANIMPAVAKTFGRYFGPHGKMPNPKAGCVVPPNANLAPLAEKLRNTVKAFAKTEASVKVKAGLEGMDLANVAENMMTVYNAVLHKLPQEKQNIKSVMVKKTMSKPVKVEEK